jgi:hypothetical protein
MAELLVGRAPADVVNKDACPNPRACDWFERYAREHRGRSDPAAHRPGSERQA